MSSSHNAHHVSRFTFHISVIVFCLCLLLIACQSDDSWERIQETGLLRVGLDPTYPPFEVDNGSELVGLDVDLARALTADLGLQVQFIYFGYDGLYDALATGQVDVLISALVVAPERTRDFAYSQSYFNAGQFLFVAADETEIREIADMAGRTLAVELGAQGHVEAISWQRSLPGLTIQPHNTPDEALTAVLDHQADAALMDAINGRLFQMNNPGLHRLSQPVTVEPYAIVTRADHQELLQQINQSLLALEQTGQLNEIVMAWLGE